MEIVQTYSQVAVNTDDQFEYQWDEGWIYQLLVCPACREVILRRQYFHEMAAGQEDISVELLYPCERGHPPGLPNAIHQAYEAALRVRSVDANAYGVLVGRLLEMICEDRNANGKDLDARLADLSSKGEIPTKLVMVAKSLRQLRNVGAHALAGELTKDEVPILDDLSRAILEYVYSAPHLVKQAGERLKRIKSRKKKKKTQKQKKEKE